MRIQHNIMAMNAYRNYNTNTAALSKNLEKLSSGYKINRAGDDAAGLAISEKMRAQITGLNAAQKNVKDGISLVKTAEGAMQEIQDMLNRMKYLATQSANGTYDEEVDRMNLQKEVNALTAEIDRIADSANFNGINLLDGKMGFGSSSSNGAAATAPRAEVDTNDAAGIGTVKVEFAADATDAQKTALSTALAGKSFKVKVTDVDGNTTVDAADKLTITGLSLPSGYTATFKAGDGTTDATFTDGTAILLGTSNDEVKPGEDIVLTIKDADGKEAGTITIGKPTKAVNGADAETTVTFAAATDNAAAGQADAAAGPTFTENTEVADKKLADFELTALDLSNVKGAKDGDVKIEYKADKTLNITVGDKTYVSAAINAAPTAGDKIKLYTAGDADGTGDDGFVEVTVDTPTNLGTTTAIAEAKVGTVKAAAAEDKNGGGAGNGQLTLQIGDTSDGFNQLTVKIEDMHTSAKMGQKFTMTLDPKTGLTTYNMQGGNTISNIDISTQDGAQKAIEVIKNAINYVSSIRGDLGAVQNRLDHTANNLSVMAENITDAESTIRDTDVAEEMMAYTKNNILIQSAQAMLAQANQVPQGVLQLLQ